MLKFGQNEIAWADIDAINLESNDSGAEVSVTVDDAVLVVGTYAAADRATSVKNLLEAAKTATSFGGVLVEVIIDDL